MPIHTPRKGPPAPPQDPLPREETRSLRIGRIVVACDFSTESSQSIRVARRLAALFPCELHILHVLERKEEADRAPIEDIRQRLEAEADRFLADGPDVSIETAVAQGTVAVAVATYAFEHHADLIVVGTRSRSELDRLLIGSTSQRLVRVSPCSVLVVRAEFTGWFDRLVAAMDFSVQAAAAAHRGITFCRLFGVDTLNLVRARSRSTRLFPRPTADGEPPEESLLLETVSGPMDEEQVLNDLQKFANQQPRVKLLTSRPEGEPAEAIRRVGVDLMEKGHQPLLLMGTRGRTEGRNVLLGSVTEQVLREAPFCVYVDRPKTLSLDYFLAVQNMEGLNRRPGPL